MLALLVYALLYPLLSPYLQALLANGRACYYHALTGKACPFCGTTRAMRALYESGAPLPTHLLVATGCAAAELLRKLGLCIAYACRPQLPVWVTRLDYGLTAGGVICLTAAFLT